jgi:peptide/nickel transport system substrate-binding protein
MQRDGREAGIPLALITCLSLLASTARCNTSAGSFKSRSEGATLRLGISNVSSQSAERGVQQFISNFSNEGLLRVNQEGRLEPWLAEGWERSGDGLRLTVRMRPNVKFHDGTPVDAAIAAKVVNESMARTPSTFEDVESIAPKGEREIEIRFRQPSSLVADALMDVPITKGTGPSAVGTGAFVSTGAISNGSAEMHAFNGYYLGRPALERIEISTFTNSRSAWAEMLRDRLDMLYEVGADAVDSMRAATNVSVYSFDRPYQYVIFFNPRNPKVKAPEIRQALNEAVDRVALVRDGLGGHGTPSVGPISVHHWAFQHMESTFKYAPQSAAAKISKPLTLRCVTLAEPPFEQMALVMKQQLSAVGINLEIEGVPVEQVMSTLSKEDFDTVLLEYSSGWSVMRAYRWWHSKGVANLMHFSSPKVDQALDHIRHAVTDSDYRLAVGEFERAIAEDPPAVFLAWSERSRAISKRFDVQPEKGRDILATLRLWRPTADKGNASHN